MYEVQNPMLRLFKYLKAYSRGLNFSIFSSVANKIFDLMPPLMIGWIIDTVSGNIPQWIGGILGISEIWSAAIFLSGLIVIVFLLESFFQWMYQYGFMTLAQKVQHDLRLDAYKQMQSREIAYFEENRTGNLMAMLNDDINQLERFLNSSFNEIVQLITLFVFGSITLFSVSWELALVGMVPIPLIFLGSIYYQRKIAPYYRDIRAAVGELSNRLENNISGISVIKSFTAEKFEYKRVSEASENYKNANFNAIKYSSLYIPVIRTFIALGLGACMLLGSYWIINDTGKLTLGELTLFAMMIQSILWPITYLGRVFDEFERARASARRVFGLMDTPNVIQNPENPLPFDHIKGHIRLQGVRFAYNQQIEILKGIDFEVASGQIVGIAGPTGAGKTTLIKLLLRLYDVTQGSIQIDGKDLREVDMHTLRRQIALVSQEVYLFHGTIAENIAYSLENVSQQTIESAAQKAQLHDFVKSLPDGYDSIIGERGIKLSGGQRQRLSIARAILKDAPILILDEATSSVDTETERAIQENLRHLTVGKTALIIAHRLSTIRHAHQIIVLKEGRIAERDTHEALVAKGGIYADLWKVQIGELVN
ncbi:MAG: ABC transporter ATP-binding protein [Chitinophagales bacterium]